MPAHRLLTPSFPRFAALAASMLTLSALGAVPARSENWSEEPSPRAEALMRGTWEIHRTKSDSEVWLGLRNDYGNGSRWQRGTRLDAKEIAGMPSLEGTERRPVELRLKRDAGTIVLTGEFAGPRGAGTFVLELDPDFPAELEKRGVGRPNQGEQAKLLVSGADFSLLDALKRERYETPRLGMLLRMADHGVDEHYVNGMARAGFRLESLDVLVQARDHGVDPHFIEGMAEAGYRNLDYETVLRARDHGADPDYVADMTEAGYGHLPLATLIKARDHGVDGNFVLGLRRAGFDKLTLEEVIRARDHGVSANYAKRVRSKRPGASLDQVIAMRDRGLSP